MLWYIWIGMLSFGIVLLLVSLILMFVFRVPELLDELSGRKAKRQIKRLKELNIGTGNLEGMVTEDFYLSMPVGLTEESKQSVDLPLPIPITNIEGEVAKQDIDEEDEIVTEEEVATGFMDDEEATTSFLGEEATGILSDVQDFIKNRKIIEVIEEQTSL